MRIAISTKRILYIACALSIACTFMISACSNSTTIAKEGDTVKVLYVGTLDDGTVFDSSELYGGEPLQFAIGTGTYLPDFEQAVVNMSINETKNIHIPFEEGYGPYYDDMIVTVNWSSFQGGFVPEVGERIQMTSQGQTFQGTVLNTSEEGVTIDFNHQLAGKNLNFEITLVEIVKSKS